MERGEHGWREAWTSPLGVMVLLLMLTLGTITWVALSAVAERRLIIEQDRLGQMRAEALHEKTADLLHCIVTAPGDLRNPNLDPGVRETTKEFLDRCFAQAHAQANAEAPPLDPSESP